MKTGRHEGGAGGQCGVEGEWCGGEVGEGQVASHTILRLAVGRLSICRGRGGRVAWLCVPPRGPRRKGGIATLRWESGVTAVVHTAAAKLGGARVGSIRHAAGELETFGGGGVDSRCVVAVRLGG